MGTNGIHIIDRLLFELDVDTIPAAHGVQNKVSRLAANGLIPELEQLLDSIAPQGDHLVIERLELDLGQIDHSRLLSQLVPGILAQIKKKLVSFDPVSGEKQAPVEHRSREKWERKIFLYFLITGSLPWFARSVLIEDEISVDRAFSTLLEKDPETVLNFVHSHYLSPQVRMRIVYHVPGIVREVSRLLQPEISEKSTQFITLVDEAFITPSEKSQLLRAVIESAGQPPDSFDVVGFGTELLRRIQSGSEELARRVIIYVRDQVKNDFDNRHNPLTAVELKEIIRVFTGLREPASVSGDSTIELTSKMINDLEKIRQLPELTTDAEPDLESDSESKSEVLPLKPQLSDLEDEVSVIDEYFIRNSGLVLVWPFLQRFFKTLELVDDSQFIDTRSRHKAMHLLHYIATGKRNAPEYAILLNKLLCGHSSGEPVPPVVELPESELDEADKLIASIIQHWEVLGNTSPGGLRESFLMRNGTLIPGGSAWRLQVEPKAYDLLLDQLPWGFSVVKLPWMQVVIYVEWR